ncbi:hypothetical protein BDV96DRAFT_571518 [Lophiotrema nucula]|uniref:NAD-dependent epimerase/dehydratase domain-containing protein n=1 Tax=Lophiotrema nucula TaxID=690887 RepID=A0A6A5ZF77_9PLEO|nr:hypothetical protein BDV96DRAFT_571518 [Lophiotrema nucula]
MEELRSIASRFDVIINPGFGPLPDQSKALVLGLGDRKKANPSLSVPHIIQQSGTSNLADRPHSMAQRKLQHEFNDFDSGEIYEYEKKLNVEEPYPQRTAELSVIDTAEEEGIKATVIMSPTIYGPGLGPVKKTSIQIPILIQTALREGEPVVVGDGTQEWDHVRVTDLADLFGLMLSKIIKGEDLGTGKDGIYFSETGRCSWEDLAKYIAEEGVRLGKLESSRVKHLELGDAARAYGMPDMVEFIELGFASNSRTVSDKTKKLGWKPKDGNEGWRKGVEEDWQEVLKAAGDASALLYKE